MKDSVNANNMPTSSGTYALKDYTPSDNADAATALVNSGAVILASRTCRNSQTHGHEETELLQLQTHNSFDPPSLSPKGSSSGSGAAAAANFSAVAIGTETTGSIIVPAAIHSIVGFKPTKDAISTAGVIPCPLP